MITVQNSLGVLFNELNFSYRMFYIYTGDEPYLFERVSIVQEKLVKIVLKASY